MLLTTQDRQDAIERLEQIEANIAEVRRIAGWPAHEATRPRFYRGNCWFSLTYSDISFRYTEAEIRPLEFASRFMLEIAHQFETNLKRLHYLVEHGVDPILLNTVDAHLEISSVNRGKLFTLLLTPNDPNRLNSLDGKQVHWLAQYDLAGEWDPLTCTYIKNSEVLTVPLPDLAEKIVHTFNDALVKHLPP